MTTNLIALFHCAANMSIARKLFRLFKSFNEYVKIKGLLKQDMPQVDKLLNILARLAFFFYWIFDNLVVLIKVKFLTSLDLKNTSRTASKFWLLGIWLSIALALHSMMQTVKDEAKLMLTKARVGTEGGISQEKYAELVKRANAKKKANMLTLVKNLGDSITASQSLGYPKSYFGFDFSDAWVGCGGMTSSAITMY